jgi:hypothetical protein
MKIKDWLKIKRAVKAGKANNASLNEMEEIIHMIDRHREFLNNLRSYMTMGQTHKMHNMYEVLNWANELVNMIETNEAKDETN